MEHIKNIKKFKNTTIPQVTCDTEILYTHFSKKDHSLETDFSFQIYISNIKNYRLRLETDLIYIFNTQHPGGLNTQSNFYHYYNETYTEPPLI